MIPSSFEHKPPPLEQLLKSQGVRDELRWKFTTETPGLFFGGESLTLKQQLEKQGFMQMAGAQAGTEIYLKNLSTWIL